MNSNEKAINEAFDTFMSQSHYTSQQNSEKTEANPDAPMEKSQQVQSNQSVSQRKVNATQRNATQCNATPEIRKVYSHHSFAEFCKQNAPVKSFIKGYIYEGALEMMYGEPACGKSFIALDMACSIACDEIHDWHGRFLRHGQVIYLAGEGAAGLRKRCAGWVAEHNVNPENVQLEIFDEVFSLDDDDSDYSIDNTIANIKNAYDKPVLIVIDTLHCFMKGDENKAVDAKSYLDACRKLIREFGSAVLTIHHVGVNQDAKNRARGSSSFRGAMDIELQVTKSESIVTLRQTKNKDSAPEKDLIFNLKGVDVPDWFDDEGLPESTCYIELCDSNLISQNEAKQNETKRKLPPSEQTAIRTFKEAVKRKGIRLKDTQTGHEFVAIELEDWRKVAYELSTKDNQSTKRGEFNKGREGLCEKNILLKRTREGYEYYCLDITADGHADDTLKIAVALAIHEHEIAQASVPKPDAQITLPIPDTQPSQTAEPQS